MTFLRLLDQLIIPFLLIFLFVGSLGGVALGCALLLRPAAAIRFIRSMNRWVSMRQATRELEIPREALRPSKWLGIFLIAGGAFACYFLVARLQIPRAAMSVADPKFVTALAVDSARWLLVAGCLVSVAMGILVLFFPGALQALEARLNQWVSTRHLLPPESGRMRTPLDLLVEAYPRAAGWTIAVSSLVVAAAVSLLIAARWLR
jgi:hypothetical protein